LFVVVVVVDLCLFIVCLWLLCFFCCF
jgi:hypothetical protein